MNNWIRVCAMLALSVVANWVWAQGKPYDPGWKYHVYHTTVDVAPDGGTTTTYEMIYTVTAESAIRQIGQQSISYHEHDGSLENVVAYTLKKDGSHVDVPASNVQVTSNNGINGTPPAFSDFMTRQLIYSNVEVGDSVVLSYTLKNVRPTFKNYYSLLHWYSDSYVYDDASYTVTAPAAMGFHQKTYLLGQPSVTAVDHDRQQWKWVYKNPVGRERPDESQSFERAWHYRELPTIEFSNFSDYGQIAAAYQQEATSRSAPTERVRKLAAEIVGDATDPRERAARIYRWVSKEIHFAGNCLTGGDVVPRDTDLILNMKMGDCKDHTTLMQALLAAENIKSTPALINTQEMGYELPEVPCWQAFNHVLNYLPEFDQYADATSSYNPFGTLPHGDRGKPTLHTIDFDHVRHTPVRGYDANFSRAKDVQTIAPDGTVDAHDNFQLGGDIANSMSKTFADWMKSPEFDDGSRYMSRAIEGMGYTGEGKYSDMPKLTGPVEASTSASSTRSTPISI
jgi:transglutaminase-like putative cysteine protease